MGWAARNNIKSRWNKNRVGKIEIPASTQTTQKEKVVQASIPPSQDEPVVIEISFKNIWEMICRRLSLSKKVQQNPALTN